MSPGRHGIVRVVACTGRVHGFDSQPILNVFPLLGYNMVAKKWEPTDQKIYGVNCQCNLKLSLAVVPGAISGLNELSMWKKHSSSLCSKKHRNGGKIFLPSCSHFSLNFPFYFLNSHEANKCFPAGVMSKLIATSRKKFVRATLCLPSFFPTTVEFWELILRSKANKFETVVEHWHQYRLSKATNYTWM